MLLKGYQKKGKGKGAEHIRLEHTLEPTQEGYLTHEELLDMGIKMREFIQNHREPFVETNAKGEKARIYEWENDKGVRFRIVTNTKTKESNTAPLPLVDEIITFYSDRNLKEKMKFKNPALNSQEKEFDLETLKKMEDEIGAKIDSYKKAHNIPEIFFGKIDDPYYNELKAQYSQVYNQIQSIHLARYNKEQEAIAQKKALQEAQTPPKVSQSKNPYPSFRKPPKRWSDIEKTKGAII